MFKHSCIAQESGWVPWLFLCAELQRKEMPMAQEWAIRFYKSRRWIKCRNTYISKRILIDGGMCEECHDRLGYIVHHKIVLNQDNINNVEISLNHDHLEYVCKQCHDEFEGHGVGKKVKPLFVFDSKGQPISLREIDKNK